MQYYNNILYDMFLKIIYSVIIKYIAYVCYVLHLMLAYQYNNNNIETIL